MDYIFLSAVRGLGLATIVVMYDIACQWGIHWVTRMNEFPTELQIDLDSTEVRKGIGKLHLPAHKGRCKEVYSLNYLPAVGRTDGEAIERAWSLTNPASFSTREMTSGHRHDTLDSLLGAINWRKVIGAGKSKIHIELNWVFADD